MSVGDVANVRHYKILGGSSLRKGSNFTFEDGLTE